MRIEKKESKGRVKIDYGDTVGPEVAFHILTGLASYIGLCSDCMFVASGKGCDKNVCFRIDACHPSSSRQARYKIDDLLDVRDCLVLLGSFGNNTEAHYLNKNSLIFKVLSKQTMEDETFDHVFSKVSGHLLHGFKTKKTLENVPGGIRVISI
jgi:hypothetical protein